MNKLSILAAFAMLMIISFPCKAQKSRQVPDKTEKYIEKVIIKDSEEDEEEKEETEKQAIIYQYVEIMPEFKGGHKAMFDFIANNLIYPPKSIEQGVEGRVIVRFIVTSEGDIQNPEIIREIDSHCGKEALRIVNLMPKWNPGKQSGKNVAVYYTLPIMFKFPEDQQHLSLNKLSTLRSNLNIRTLGEIYDNTQKDKNRIQEVIDTLLVIHKSRGKSYAKDSIAETLIYYTGSLYLESGKHKEAIKYAKEGVKLAPTNYHFYNLYGLCLSAFGNATKGKKAERYYKDALDYYYKALEVYPSTRKNIKSYPSKVHRNIGFRYLYKAYNTDDTALKETYFEKASEHFEHVTGSEWQTTPLCLNWALSLGYLAEYKSEELADSLYHRAIEILQEEEKDGISETYENYYLWGGVLQTLGNRRNGEEADSLYKESIKRLEKALTFIPNVEQVSINSTDAVKLRNCYMALQCAYIKRAYSEIRTTTNVFIELAVDCGEKAIALGAQPYNHACMYALMDDAEKAFPLLRQVLKQKEITFKKVESDTDWDKLRNHAEYKKLKKKYKL